MANASSCFTPLRVVACCCKDCILPRQAPRERRPQTPHSLPSLFCLFYPTIAIATLQSLNPENATPTSKQPKLCTLSLQKKTRERERERVRFPLRRRREGFTTSPIAANRERWENTRFVAPPQMRIWRKKIRHTFRSLCFSHKSCVKSIDDNLHFQTYPPLLHRSTKIAKLRYCLLRKTPQARYCFL